MVGFTISTQMEMFALPVLTNTGQNFFRLFAPERKGKLEARDQISWKDVEDRWPEIDAQKKGWITKEEAQGYLAKHPGGGFVSELLNWTNTQFQLLTDLKHLFVFLILVALFRAVTMFLNNYSASLVSIRVSRDLRQQYFEHIQLLPMNFYQQYNIGSLTSRVSSDAQVVADSMNQFLIHYVQTPFAVASSLVICFLTSWQLSIIIFIGFPLIVLPVAIYSKHVRRLSRKMQKKQENYTSVLLDFLGGIQTIKIFAMEKFALKKYVEENNDIAHLSAKSAKYSTTSRPLLHFISSLFLGCIMLFGLYFLDMSVSEILFYGGILYLFYEPVKKLAEQTIAIQRGVAAAERVCEILDIEPEIQDEPNAVELVDFRESIEFRNVSFKYKENWVLKEISFKVKKGDSIALVGPTGAGKSTIVQLLPRLYEPQQGEILIDGIRIDKYTQKSLRQNVAYVSQKPFLFQDSVAENIAYGESYTRQEVVDAATRAHADEFIVEMPQGYDTQLAEMGKNLSGGQQQRIAIARALVKKAPILVLDEATSSLDNVSEHRIKQAVLELKSKVTQIIIAHRLSTIEGVDRILYIDNGKKIAEGTKEELLKTCPSFKAMWELMKVADQKEEED